MRPYRCKECNRLFSRQDSLARHEKLHNQKETNDYPSPSPTHSTQSSRISTSLSPIEIPGISSDIPQSQPTPAQISTTEEEIAISGMQHVPMSADLDFDLIWPDSEDLFATLMAPDSTNQWQMPQNTFPISSQSLYGFGTSTSIVDKESPMSSVCSGESHKAVHNVSEMVTSLVSRVHFGSKTTLTVDSHFP